MITPLDDAAWNQPPPCCRPLQIIHGFDLFLTRLPPDVKTLRDGLSELKRRGLGGVVCNVSFTDYLRSDEQWSFFLQGLELCAELGLRVWLYDEEGYPSGIAGGLILKQDPTVEAEELVCDPEQTAPFYVRRAYEHTAAAHSWYKCRRLPNLISKRAVALFIELTHAAYQKHCGQYFGGLIEAFFTDEPALLTVQWGVPTDMNQTVAIQDPPDPNVKALPGVPWVADLPELYQKKYNADLMTQLPSLFGGQTEADRVVRRNYWSLIGDLLAERYFGKIQQWCEMRGLASSGHTLCEEAPHLHVPLMGHALECLRRMTIPGLDMLTSDPVDVRGLGWLAAVMPGSAAVHRGARLVMTEVCNHIQREWGKRVRVEPDEMCSTAAWHAAFGVTEFTLYYDLRLWSADEYRHYCDTVGRLNAVLRDAAIRPRVLLYYPMEDLQSDFIPVAGNFDINSLSERLQRMLASFIRLGQMLAMNQAAFILADTRYLANARHEQGRLVIGNQSYDCLLLPEGVELPAINAVHAWARQDQSVFYDRPNAPLAFQDLQPRYVPGVVLEPAAAWIIAGEFERDGRPVILLANVGATAYHGSAKMRGAAKWLQYFPESGVIEPARTASRTVTLNLPPRSSVLLVAAPTEERNGRK